MRAIVCLCVVIGLLTGGPVAVTAQSDPPYAACAAAAELWQLNWESDNPAESEWSKNAGPFLRDLGWSALLARRHPSEDEMLAYERALKQLRANPALFQATKAACRKLDARTWLPALPPAGPGEPSQCFEEWPDPKVIMRPRLNGSKADVCDGARAMVAGYDASLERMESGKETCRLREFTYLNASRLRNRWASIAAQGHCSGRQVERG